LGFQATHKILHEIGLVVSDNKTIAPALVCTCLGIVIDTKKSTLAIPAAKLKAIIGMCTQFSEFKKLRKTAASITLRVPYIHSQGHTSGKIIRQPHNCPP
jgi:hypothetical protein